MPDISRSVGRGGTNDDDDVIIVQRLLNAVSLMKGGANPIVDIDGWCGQKTINAIARFQDHRSHRETETERQRQREGSGLKY